jgi:hypothetical protein
MSDFDLINPYGGSFRAKLAANWPSGDIRKPYGVGLDAAGKVVKGKGHNGTIRGVIVLTKARKANETVDVMRFGEITNFAPTAGVPDTDFGVAGTDYFADNSTGIITATATADSTPIGFTATGDRLIVTVDTGVPGSKPPAGLSVPAKTATTVTLSWAAVQGATGYVLQKAVSPFSTFTNATVQPVGTATTATDTGLTTATAYQYRVAAIVGGVTQGYSAPVAVTTS